MSKHKNKHFHSSGKKYPEVLKKRVRDEQALMTQWSMQMCLDIMSGILNDKNVMGKDVFGKTRLTKIGLEFNKRWPDWFIALTPHPEADVVRKQIDDRLIQIYGEDMPKWVERYEYFED